MAIPLDAKSLNEMVKDEKCLNEMVKDEKGI
jgi:hypothetical protein